MMLSNFRVASTVPGFCISASMPSAGNKAAIRYATSPTRPYTYMLPFGYQLGVAYPCAYRVCLRSRRAVSAAMSRIFSFLGFMRSQTKAEDFDSASGTDGNDALKKIIVELKLRGNYMAQKKPGHRARPLFAKS